MKLTLSDCAKFIDSLGSNDFLNQLLQFIHRYIPTQTLQLHRLQLSAGKNSIDDVEYFGSASMGDCPITTIDEGGRDLLLRYSLYSRECPDIQRFENLTSGTNAWISSPTDIQSKSLRDFYFDEGYFRQFAVYAALRQHSIYVLWLGRLHNDNDFSQVDLAILQQLSELLSPLLAQHANSIQAQLSLKQRPVDLQLKVQQQLSRNNIVLSKRELEVCLGILQGQQAPEIALKLGVAKTSIATYKKRAFEKIGVKTQQQFFNWCFLRPTVLN
ncbi:helix-turn-helix transcriptional regulator [Dasania sp. GY-MA-18]|uniref:Helix-turn-helix transcriptional regulator n=1 Tax=Dasania phycosphaerae TaxID=2950436 RepID=A0A9J6RPB3_9GAMM|nr:MULTISPECIES: helix-turn-helix transcriptional regulator [Dasania]MCR8923922.1 helix-turn-helix transcriptional regulator [Dasania sp. GY-MA-18]MCZ0866356.1 helix-turn-helix transcriptional regulator [Dasania phycosphaerae]MCZ0870080.1 helix-turn-helix transcriptional regulator [Dasania phycosphaerae]